jgi:hypothetical protein
VLTIVIDEEDDRHALPSGRRPGSPALASLASLNCAMAIAIKSDRGRIRAGQFQLQYPAQDMK